MCFGNKLSYIGKLQGRWLWDPKRGGKRMPMRRSGQKIILIRGSLIYCKEAGKWNSEREQTFPGIHDCFREESEIM